jgi:hypothetical protein
MGNYNDLVLFQKIYDLILWIYPRINKFPKNQRFVLGQRIENTLLRLIELSIELNSGAYNDKYVIKKMSLELDKLRILIRLSKDLYFFNKRRYLFVSEKINEIGRLIGGMNSFLKNDKG